MENIYSLKDFELNEAAGKRGRPRKNATPENDDGSITVVAGGQVKDVEPSDINKLKGKDEKWLYDKLRKLKIKMEDIILLAIDEQNNIVTYTEE